MNPGRLQYMIPPNRRDAVTDVLVGYVIDMDDHLATSGVIAKLGPRGRADGVSFTGPVRLTFSRVLPLA